MHLYLLRIAHHRSLGPGTARCHTAYNPRLYGNTVPTDQIAERVERLLLRHAELQRTNALLADQVAALTQERDSLKSRLSAARARVDALLERLPAAAPLTKEAE